MYRRFRFEGTIHDSLDCVPLAVRRKLDLAGLKISLVGWQTLTHAERVALCHLPVESAEEIVVYQQVLRGFAARSAVPLSPLPDSASDPGAWRTPAVPSSLKARQEAGVLLSDADWRGLGEEERYALVKLSEPKRTAEKLQELLAELGLAPPVGGELPAGRSNCLAPGVSPGRT